MNRLKVSIRAGLLTAALSVAAVITPASAPAYTHAWNCNVWEYQQCYDNAGAQYNPWERISFTTVVFNTWPEVCAKGVTQANNIRTGSGCSSGASSRNSNIAGGSPSSLAYGYYGGCQCHRAFDGYANTSD